MFSLLSDKLQGIFSKAFGGKTLTEENLTEGIREVRLALLEADVHYGVAKKLIQRVKEEALGERVTKSVKPAEQFVKILHDELVALMGSEEAPLNLKGYPAVILMCGLQGSGKTTQSVKLACYLKREGKRVLVAACDLARPAAVEQLKTLGRGVEVDIFSLEGEKRPLAVAESALSHAKRERYDALIVDTAGRLHVDEPLMEELSLLKKRLNPDEVLFVANATTGQDAVKSASEIDGRIGITGSILTMLDGDARGGAAISIREVTGKPLKFEGVGEKPGDLQLFNPHSMADRILGMGDVVNLVKRAQEVVSEEEAEKLQKKLRKATFTYEDYLSQMQKVKKIGSMSKILKMLPLKGVDTSMLEGSDGELAKVESIILSMTPRERNLIDELSMGRRRRIAMGSGRDLAEVNRLIKGFNRTKTLFRKGPGKQQLDKMLGGMK
ncbi:MAG: signal recognition particle protein [Parachlamydiales bacterium]